MANARVLLIVSTIFICGGFFLYTRKKQHVDSTLFLFPNGDGTYRVEEKNNIEPYQDDSEINQGSRQPRVMIQYVPTNMSTIEAFFDRGLDPNKPCPAGVPCRTVRSDNKVDMLWWLQMVHRDIDAVSWESILNLPNHGQDLSLLELLSENPLTYTIDGENKLIVGQSEASLAQEYILILLLYKKLGRPLPKPDPTIDYTYYNWIVMTEPELQPLDQTKGHRIYD